jgi:hypothetical protein
MVPRKNPLDPGTSAKKSGYGNAATGVGRTMLRAASWSRLSRAISASSIRSRSAAWLLWLAARDSCDFCSSTALTRTHREDIYGQGPPKSFPPCK